MKKVRDLHINHAHCCASANAALDQLVVCGQVGWIQCSSKLVVDEELPRDGKSEGVQAIIIDEMLHLLDAISVRRDVEGVGSVASAIDSAAKVKSSNVYASKGYFSST